MNWQFFHRLSSPKGFYQFSSACIYWVGSLACAFMLVGVLWGLLFTPPDYLQGDSYRIIYIHVPAASLSISIYIAMAVSGGVGFVWRIKLAYLAAKSLAPIGTSFCLLALLSGSIWGKPTWGTWWVWDARLTSMLVLLFLYLGQIALRQSILNKDNANRACAILGLVGVINLPIIKYSVVWWNTLHQGASITFNKASIAVEMLYPLLLSIAGFYLFCLFVFLLRMRQEIITSEYKARWVKQLCLKV